MATVFISYSRSDEQLASRLYKDLRTRDLEVWFDKECLIVGQDWKVAIQEAISKADFVVLLLSNTAVAKRGYFQKEVKITLDVLQTIPFGHIYLLPVRLEACQIPAQLSAIQCGELFPDWDHGLEKLLKAIEIQSRIQLSARSAEQEQAWGEASILLVNDEPATMNLAVDIWKSHELKVEYAFDVNQAIKAIQKSPQMIIVSDLSHFSFGRLVTDRAGFEILEWARSHGRDIRLIVSTSKVTQARRDAARRLGATGICDNHADLHDLIAKETGVSIKVPDGVSGTRIRRATDLEGRAGDFADIAKQDPPRVSIFGARCDGSFTGRLAHDLNTRGFDVVQQSQPRVWGRNVLDSDFDFSIIIFSRESKEKENIFKEFPVDHMLLLCIRNGYEVIPVVLDDDAVEYIPRQVQGKLQYADFRRDYDEAIKDRVERIKRCSGRRARLVDP
jgi:CheY-like chemotaxis protein